jgi:uracil-DNA glycosylase family 4
MHPARRLEYLDALGIRVYARRAMPAEGPVSSGASLSSPTAERATVSLEGATVAVAPPAPWTWETLRQRVAECHACEALAAGRTQTVFGVGNPQATWMIVGEAPGADEDHQGEPFVGRAGQLLNAMLQAMGLARAEVFIANVLKCRPADNRDPHEDEMANCEAYLQGQIALVQPEILLVVGRIAAQSLLKTTASLASLRGRLHHYGEQGIPLVVTYHPAYLLRYPDKKANSWDDLQLAVGSVRRQSA